LRVLKPHRKDLHECAYDDKPESCGWFKECIGSKPSSNRRVWVVDDLSGDMRRWSIRIIDVVSVPVKELCEESRHLKLNYAS